MSEIPARRAREAGEPVVPQAVERFWADLLARAHVSDTGVELTRVLCLLAAAKEPLPEDLLAELLAGEHPFDGPDGRELLKDAIESGRAFIRWAPSVGGIEALLPAHPALRALLAKDDRTRRSMHWARQRLLGTAALVDRGQVDTPLGGYAVRHGVEHLIEEGGGHQLVPLLTSSRYLVLKARSAGIGSLLRDLQLTLASPVLADPTDRKKIHALWKALEGRTASLKADPDRVPVEAANALLAHTNVDMAVRDLADELARQSSRPGREALVVRCGKPDQLIAPARLLDLLGPGNWITSMARGADGRLVALATGNQTVLIWDSKECRQIALLEGHTDHINSVAFSRDGNLVVTGSVDRAARVWDMSKGRTLAVLTGHTDEVTAVAVGASGNVITGSWDGTMRIWDARAGRELQRFTGENRLANCLADSPDGSCIVSGSWEKVVRLWDTAGGQLLATLTGHTDRVMSVAWSRDGRWISSGSTDGTVVIWSPTTLAAVTTIRIGGAISLCQFSPDGRFVWVVDDGGVSSQRRLCAVELVGS